MTLPDNLAFDEQVTRYIFSRSHFRTSDNTVKYSAYLPAPNGETSVYRTSSISGDEVWDIGWEHVAKPRDRTLRARGDTVASVIVKTGLEIVPETTLHPLHANIIGWPPERDLQKMLAVEIANETALAIVPD